MNKGTTITEIVTGRERHVDSAREGFVPYPHRALRTPASKVRVTTCLSGGSLTSAFGKLQGSVGSEQPSSIDVGERLASLRRGRRLTAPKPIRLPTLSHW